MQFEQSLSQIALPQVEPIGQLAPYLSGLNLADAVHSFSQLADLVALADGEQAEAPERAGGGAADPQWAQCLSPWNAESSATSDSATLSSSSASVSDGSQWLSSSAASSPRAGAAEEASPFAGWSRSIGSSSASSSVSSVSTRSLNWTTSSSSRSSSSSSRSSRASSARSPRVGERRQKNASAAEKYRRKLKGRECSLAEQVEREEERNERLKREIEAKLALYREFVDLLASNTSPNDLGLASMGSKSLSAVLTGVLSGRADEELQRRLAQFQQILSSAGASSSSCSSSACSPAPTAGALEYDFFTDTFVSSCS